MSAAANSTCEWRLYWRCELKGFAALPAASVGLIAFDFDGVLTDNRVLVLQDGTEGVLCNRADGLAF